MSKNEDEPINLEKTETEAPQGGNVGSQDEGFTWGKCLTFFFKPELTMQTFYGVTLGLILGLALADVHISENVIAIIGYPGEIYIQALKMVVIPMIICDMVQAVIRLGDINKIKYIGSRALGYYLFTTFFACIEGLIMVEIFRPGVSRGQSRSNTTAESLFSETCQVTVGDTHYGCVPAVVQKPPQDAFLDLGRSLIPANIVEAFRDFNILGIIFFTVLYAFYVAKEEKAAIVKDFFEVSGNAFMNIVMGIIWWTPLGIFSLVFSIILKEEDFGGLMVSLGEYVGATVTGILFHLLFFYPLLYFLNTRKNPYVMLPKMIQPMLTAFATSSSAATLPVTIKTAEKNGVNKDISKFMIPLGATINMDGTAIYFPIAVIYLANVLNHPLNFGNKIAISIVSAMVSIGAAPIPNAGLVYLILIMDAVGIPVDGSLTFVLSIDWLVDRMQTACNVTGDGFGALILEHHRKKEPRMDPGTTPARVRHSSQIMYVQEAKQDVEDH